VRVLGVARVVHETEHGVDVDADGADGDAARELLGEGEGCGLDLLRFSRGVEVLPDEFAGWRGWCAEGEGQDEVDLADHFLLGCTDGRAGGGGGHGAKNQGVFAQFGCNQAIDCPGVLGVVAVGIEHLGDEPVLGDQVEDHIPLAAIADGLGEEGLDEAAVEVFVCGVEDLLEEVVGLLELVPEEEVGLAELEGVEVVALHDGDAEDVCGGEEPAAAGGALVRDWGAFEGDLDIEDVLVP